MAFHKAKPVVRKTTSGTGISMALRVTKHTRSARITMSADAQNRLFGALIAGRGLDVQIGYGADEGKIAICLDDESEIKVMPGIKDSIAFSVAAWDLLPKDKRPSASCDVREVNGATVVLDLPDWTRPSKTGGRIASEHSLPPIPRAPKPVIDKATRLHNQAAAIDKAAKG